MGRACQRASGDLVPRTAARECAAGAAAAAGGGFFLLFFYYYFFFFALVTLLTAVCARGAPGSLPLLGDGAPDSLRRARGCRAAGAAPWTNSLFAASHPVIRLARMWRGVAESNPSL